jgi:hypothetical protein
MLIRCQWDGDAFVPTRPYKARCDQEYVVGEIYDVDPMLPRSMASHRHFFARIAELWQNLPEGLDLEYPSAEHLRKRMLINVGWCDSRDFVTASNRGALELASYLQGMDEYSVVEVVGQVVRLWTAKSQSVRKQDRKAFQETKQRVLDEIEAMIGLDTDANADVAQDHADAVADPPPHPRPLFP